MAGRLKNSRLREAAAYLDCGDPAGAERILARYLERVPHDGAALGLLAEAALLRGETKEAALRFARYFEQGGGSAVSMYEYADLLFRRNVPLSALAGVERLLRENPDDTNALDLKAVILAAVGRHEEAADCRAQLVRLKPDSTEARVRLGDALRSLGKHGACIESYRQAIAIEPHCGQAWLSLANLRNTTLANDDIAAMQTALASADLSGDERMCFNFALGRALGQRGDYARSFEHYARANAIKRAGFDYDPESLTRHVRHCQALFTPEFFSSRVALGSPAPDPVFIVGMQRAGSTLVEQILGCHPAVSALGELSDIALLVRHAAERSGSKPEEFYSGALARLDAALPGNLAERYLESTRFRRDEHRPRFVDKMPYNFLHLGFIHLILPKAKIIDVRRHPLACCFSNFTVNFNSGALFAYRLSELGRAYKDYVELMAHFDAVLPGRIHRVFYEDLVREPEREVRRLLDYLGLPFEPSCLDFHHNRRAIESASAEQIRRPLYTEAIGHWKNYEPWLGALKSALGPVLDAYPATHTR